jgi:uncharacterized repeat protein (TIGR01451 family)
MNIKLILVALLLPAIIATSGLANVVINEVELDSPGEDTQWVELYNTGDTDVDITGWSITPMSDPTRETFIGFENISAKGFYVLTFVDGWLNQNEEELILRNDEGVKVDSTPALYDLDDSDCSWGRYPDGSENWASMESTPGEPSSGTPCGDAESLSIRFNMNQRVSGSGYVRIRNTIENSEGASLKSTASGSGTYESEEAAKYYENLNSSTYAINLSKSKSVRYSDTTFNVTPKRSVRYATKWSESSTVGSNDKDSPSLSESYTYATRLDSDVMIDYRNFDMEASIGSEFEGVGRIKLNLEDLESSEEYIGAFKIFNNYLKNDSNELELSATGEGFVNTDREIGDEIKTYERGTGLYQSDALIDASGSSLAKDISLRYAPANYSNARDNPMPMSLMWEEGTFSGKRNGSFMSSEFSDIRSLDAETAIISSGDMRTSASFTGRARLQAGYRNSSDPVQKFVFIDDEYLGNFSIERRYKVSPVLKVPHMTLTSLGRIDPQDCNKLKYTITLANDGNRAIGPVFVRSSFPTGTSYIDSSFQPFELTSRYANWSISYLGIGESFNIDLNLQINTRRENYTSSSRAITIYKAQTSTGTSDRRLRASNTSRLEADWSFCSPQSLSAAYTVAPNSRNPKILAYRLALENLAEENMSVNITATLPPNTKFINSTTKPEQIGEDSITWTIDKLNTGRRRTISFMAEAENDGFYVSRADVRARSLDGREMASLNLSASIVLGDVVYVIRPTSLQDWCPCDENLLGSLTWNETMIAKSKDLGCVC